MLRTIPTEAHATGDVGGTILESLTSGFDAGHVDDLGFGIATKFSLNHAEDFMGQSLPLITVLGAVGQCIVQGHCLKGGYLL